MKYFIVLSLLLAGCATTKKTIVPKYKVGDCIRTHGSFERVVKSINLNDPIAPSYGLIIGMCRVDQWFACSTTVGDIEIIDPNSELIECKYERN